MEYREFAFTTRSNMVHVIMSYGKMNAFIDIISTAPIKDSEGFVTKGDTVLDSVRAYREDRHGSEKWTNLATYSTASSIFRFRRNPDLLVTTEMTILCKDERYQILSVEDVRGRGMYIEVLTQVIEPSVR